MDFAGAARLTPAEEIGMVTCGIHGTALVRSGQDIVNAAFTLTAKSGGAGACGR
jgi:hypothetical protein